MSAPTTEWDKAPTDAELTRFYGTPRSTLVKDQIIETITETVRKVDYRCLSVPYVKYSSIGAPKVMPYPVDEVFADYGTEPKLLKTLMEIVSKSDCPIVAKWRKEIAERFADSHADEVEEMRS